MAARGDQGAPSEWRRSWPVVLAATAGTAFATVNIYSTGVMIPSLQRAFGWSRAEISSGPAIVATLGAVGAPVVGMIVGQRSTPINSRS